MPKKTQILKIKSQNFLEEIVKIKREELLQKTQNTQNSRQSDNQNLGNSETLKFHKLFKNEDKRMKLIAELKFASPTNPHLGSSRELVERAKQYELVGADAISIITEKHFFKGDMSFISKVKEHLNVPILQKDFIIDPVQIYEAKDAGADALLLIARLVDGRQLKTFVSLCFSIGIDPVVEINNEEDLEKTLVSDTHIVAVNARNLEKFEVDVQKACLLLEGIPDQFIKLGFSGISSQKEVIQYQKAGAKGILVGASMMMAKDKKHFIEELSL